MTQKDIKEKMMKDLKEPERRARAYAKQFCDRFDGNIRAITYILASYTPNGDIRVSYIIANRRYYFVVNGRHPFSKKSNL